MVVYLLKLATSPHPMEELVASASPKMVELLELAISRHRVEDLAALVSRKKAVGPKMAAATCHLRTVLLLGLATCAGPMAEAAMAGAAVTAVMESAVSYQTMAVVSKAWPPSQVEALAASPHPKRPWRTTPHPRMTTHPVQQRPCTPRGHAHLPIPFPMTLAWPAACLRDMGKYTLAENSV